MRREGPLNWPQSSWLSGYRVDSDDAYGDNLVIEIVPSPAQPLDRVVAAIASLVNRHEALRTSFLLESGASIVGQRVGERVQDTDLSRFIQVTAADEYPHALAASKRKPIRIIDNWPFHVVLRHREKVVDAVGFIVDHSACDLWGRNVLVRDFSAILDGSSSMTLPGQPLDLVEWERSNAGQKHLEKGLTFWSQQVEHIHNVLGDDVASAANLVSASDAPYRTYKVRSRRLLLAAQRAAADVGVPVSASVLHSYGLALGNVNDSPGIGVLMLIANRSLATFRQSVSNMFTCVPVIVEQPENAGVDKGLAETYFRQIRAHRVGAVDPSALEVVISDRLPNATSLDIMGAYFNYIDGSVGPGADPAAQIGDDRTSEEFVISTGPPVPRGAPLMLTAIASKYEMELRLTCRTDLKWDRMAESLLRLTVSNMCPELVA